jgi:cardiolipin synthase
VAWHDVLLKLAAVVHVAVAGAFVFDLLRQHRSAAATIAWIAILLLLPYAGLALYVLAGSPRKRSAALAEYLAAHVHPPADAAAGLCPDTERLLRALGLPGATGGNRVEFCRANGQAHGALLGVIRGARQRLLLSVFSFEADAAGIEILEAMRERAVAGVKVRMLVDGYGSLELGTPAVRALVAAGGRVARHRPLVHRGSLRGAFNSRNHRKLVVADGAMAWLGGRNMAAKYLRDDPAAGGASAAWADFSLVIAGPAAAVLESVFRSDWLTASGETLGADAAAPTVPGGSSTVQVLASGPDMPDDTLHAMLMTGVAGARQRVWITSPFFIPDDALQSMLRLACRRGVDVRVLVPRRSNLPFADVVRTGYLDELASAGARVEFFEPTVLHAKLLVVDDRVAMVGSANLDMRSLFTNHEVAAVLYSAADIAATAAAIEAFAADASAYVPAAGFARTARAGALRILAPLL